MATYGPYSQVRQAGDMYFVSGQIGIDAANGSTGSDVIVQARQVLENMQKCLNDAGLDMNHVVKVTIYLKNIDDFAVVNDVYQMFFDVPRPARACVEVSDLPHVGDKPLLVEMDAVAYKATDD